MLEKMIVVALVFTITGTKAGISNENAVNGLLDYSTPLSSVAKNSASVTALSELIKGVSDLLEKNMKTIDIENLQSVIAKCINKLTFDTDKQPMLYDLEQLKTSASALEVKNLFSAISEELLIKLTLYFEDLQAKVEKNALTVSKKLESVMLDLNTRLVTSDSMLFSLNLYNLENTILECLEEVRVSLNLYSEKVTEKLGQQTLILVNNVSPYGVDKYERLKKTFEGTCFQIKKNVYDMQTNFLVKASQLKEQMGFIKHSLLTKTYLDFSNAKKTTFVSLTDMSQKIFLLKDTVVFYGESLRKALVDGVEDMKKTVALYNIQDSTRILDKSMLAKLFSFMNSTLSVGDK